MTEQEQLMQQWLLNEMASIYVSFSDDKEFLEFTELAGSQEEMMRIFDVGFIAGLEYVKRNTDKFFQQQ